LEHTPQPLTIGVFTDTYQPETNGVVTSIVSTTRALRRRGHRVIVVAPAHPEGDEEHPDVFHLRSASFPFYPGFRMAFPLPAKVVANLPAVPFDVIHAQTFFFIGCLGAYLARLRTTPLFFTYHTKFEDYLHYLPVHQRITKPQTLWLSREFSNQCDRVIAPSQGTADLLRSYGITAPLEILPGGVDLESFGPDTPEPSVIREGRPGPIVLSVGRLGKEKNLELLLDAFALTLRAHPTARLIMVGDGPHRPELEQRAEALGAAGRIIFVGALDQAQLGAYYRNADVFLFASLTETQGLVLVEALAHGLPVVAVDCAVTREIIIGDSGILTSDSASALADALAVIVDNPAERAHRAAAARQAAAPFSIDALAERLETLYVRARSDLAHKGNLVFTRRQR
jgi:1,2-diacylglycerol 3-alpha-glucosyltransferase